MVREKDEFVREHFEQTNDTFKCKYCGQVFNGKPSVTRLRNHLQGNKGQGARTCGRVPEQVKVAIQAGDSNKRRRIESNSVNDEMPNLASTSIPPQYNHLAVHGTEGCQNVVHDAEQDRSHEVIVESSDPDAMLKQFSTREDRAIPLLTRELVGETYKRKLDEIWLSLKKEHVSKVGIYGMGGVGKTELAKHIHNKLLVHWNYDHVCWITVPSDFSIHKLQNAIAKAMNFDLSNEDDEIIRAAQLSRRLNEKKFVIILDDVWSYIPLQSVGMTDDGLKGCKLILTTRSLHICRTMNCQKNVLVDCHRNLRWDNGDWKMFIKELGKEASLSGEIEMVAKSIVKRCDGLPLMIISMAISMRGVERLHEWRTALEEMRSSKMSEPYVEVFRKLKRSYDHLEDQSLQQCFLYCALFYYKDEEEEKEELIEHLIVEGITEGTGNRRAKLDSGHTLLKKLEDACLLQRNVFGGVHMHVSVRKMAFQIMKESLPSIIEIGEKIKYLPDKQQPKEAMMRISLCELDRSFNPFDYAAMCPNVSTLLLQNNEWLISIEDSFYDKFQRLKILSVSGSSIRVLPESVGGLKYLKALFLRKCKELRDIPSLAKLESLEVLDLYGCKSVEQVPEGVELLSNLRILNLLWTGIDELRAGILRRLVHLEFLAFHRPSKNVSADVVAGLPKLEYLMWCFSDIDELYTFLDDAQSISLITYSLVVGPDDMQKLTEVSTREGSSRKVWLRNGCICNINRELRIQKGIQMLSIRNVSTEEGSGFCLKTEIGPNSSEVELKSLRIEGIKEVIEYLFCLSSSPTMLQRVESVQLIDLRQLRNLFGRERDSGVPPSTIISDASTFSNLKAFKITCCDTIKKLFPPGLLANLQNLERIYVWDCPAMEEIIAAPEQESSYSNSHSNFIQPLQSSLPKLKTLELVFLPKLKRICRAQLKCDSLEYIRILFCENLKDIPISLPLPSLAKLEIFSKMWWESVVWGLPGQKDVLQLKCIHNENDSS